AGDWGGRAASAHAWLGCSRASWRTRRSRVSRLSGLRSAATAASSAPRSPSPVSLSLMLRETGLWRDLHELPETLAATLEVRDGFAETAALLGASDVRRVVASGNGAAYYVTMALWLAALEGRGGLELVAVPAGLLARGAFRWRPGDALLAVSSSGELRDLIEAIDAGAPEPF